MATAHTKRVLLTSVFKPFAVDDEFGSRAINPAELYHNQVTREQGPFSLRVFHRTPKGKALRQSTDAVNEALKALEGQRIEELMFSPAGPGAVVFIPPAHRVGAGWDDYGGEM